MSGRFDHYHSDDGDEIARREDAAHLGFRGREERDAGSSNSCSPGVVGERGGVELVKGDQGIGVLGEAIGGK
jgi:hypothetical protein